MDTPILLLVFLIIYFTTLFVLKNMGFMEKNVCDNCANCCPQCNEPLERIRRNNSDRIINLITFQMFGFKRYKCNHCYWEGLRWENKFDKKSQHLK